MMSSPQTRVWPRHQVDLPVRIAPANKFSEVRVPGLATELSRTGVAVYAGIDLEPGDLMEVEFEAPSQVRVVATVRNRSGYCFGLAFVAVLGRAGHEQGGLVPPEPPTNSDVEPISSSPILRAQAVRTQDRLVAIILHRHEAFLRQKELEIRRTRQELLKVRQLQNDIEIIRDIRSSENLR